MFSITFKKIGCNFAKTTSFENSKMGSCCPMTAAITTVLKGNNMQPQIVET